MRQSVLASFGEPQNRSLECGQRLSGLGGRSGDRQDAESPDNRLRSHEASARQWLLGVTAVRTLQVLVLDLVRCRRAAQDNSGPAYAVAVAAAPGISSRAPEVFDAPPNQYTLPRPIAQPSPSTEIARVPLPRSGRQGSTFAVLALAS